MSQKNSSSTKEFDLSSNFSSPLEDSSAPTWPYKWWIKNQQLCLFKATLKCRSRWTELEPRTPWRGMPIARLVLACPVAVAKLETNGLKTKKIEELSAKGFLGINRVWQRSKCSTIVSNWLWKGKAYSRAIWRTERMALTKSFCRRGDR